MKPVYDDTTGSAGLHGDAEADGSGDDCHGD